MLRSFLVLSLLLVAGGARGQDEFVHFGARALGMGGAFTAVADDFSAFYWNPAGYKFGPIADVGAGFGEAGEDRTFGVATGFTFMGVAGTSTRQAVTTDSGVHRLETFDLSVSILQSLPIDDLVVATNVHYLRAGFDGMDRSAAFTLDVSALYEPAPWFRAGVMWRRLVEPEISVPDGDGGLYRLERHARAGVSFALRGATRFALDADLSRQAYGREFAFGVEKAFYDRAISLRWGVRADLGGDFGARPTMAFGAGGRIRWLVVDVAYETSADERRERFFFGVGLSL